MIERNNIGIVTVYNTYNYGSILQAEALSKVLGSQGNVFFVKTEARNGLLLGIKEILIGIKSLRIK